MSANDNANELVWLAYCDIIKSNIGKLGDSNAIFFSTQRPSCPDYNTVAVGWQATATKPAKGANAHNLTLENGKKVDKASFGQKSFSGSHETLETHVTESNVSITMTWDDMQKVTVSPGNWNISNPRGDYPKLKPDAPNSAKILVRPSQLVLVNKLGFTVSFTGSIKDEFNEKHTRIAKAGGSVSILGIPIRVGPSVSDTQTSTTHNGSWDSSSGVFTATPDAQVGFANVIAVVGEKVETF
ncbi:hypothetical protein GQX73_g1370 [Xylaria multiplex]|uniref:Uncharacterized protein n=1 Tax=Xylaria multiplex TaxID=323545 RepID=A0A7C8NCE9_9PEZI|nr:hypothetical protein GQX73_g1370 [Xylaria multiplex]